MEVKRDRLERERGGEVKSGEVKRWKGGEI